MSTCPDCHAAIVSDDINVAKDIAFCRPCNKPFALSALVHGTVVPSNIDLANPPQGAWYRDDGVVVEMGATTRAVGLAIFFLFFSSFWNAITWTFVIGAIWGLFSGASNAASPTNPAGPASSSSSNPPGFTLLFMIPFILVGLVTAVAVLFYLFGAVRVTMRGTEGLITTGVGPILRRRRFNPADVVDVAIEPASWRQNNQTVYQIVLKTMDLKFGSGLTTARREFLAAALRQQLGR